MRTTSSARSSRRGRGGRGHAHLDAARRCCDKVFAFEAEGAGLRHRFGQGPADTQPARRRRSKGMMVCSIHPMFGPDTASLIYARNLIVCDCGSERAVDGVRCPGGRHRARTSSRCRWRSTTSSCPYVLGMSPRREHRLLRRAGEERAQLQGAGDSLLDHLPNQQMHTSGVSPREP